MAEGEGPISSKTEISKYFVGIAILAPQLVNSKRTCPSASKSLGIPNGRAGGEE